MPSLSSLTLEVYLDVSRLNKAFEQIYKCLLDLDFILNYTDELGEPEWEVFT